MKENVGELDKNIRFMAGGALLATALVGNVGLPWRIAALLIGASELITATTRYCPMNALIGIDTNREPFSGWQQNPPQPAAPITDVSFAG